MSRSDHERGDLRGSRRERCELFDLLDGEEPIPGDWLVPIHLNFDSLRFLSVRCLKFSFGGWNSTSNGRRSQKALFDSNKSLRVSDKLFHTFLLEYRDTDCFAQSATQLAGTRSRRFASFSFIGEKLTKREYWNVLVRPRASQMSGVR